MDKEPLVLIVDDVQSNLELLGNILKTEYAIRVASNGKSALELASIKPLPDIILLDIEMPEIDGFEVLKQLKNNLLTANIPVIFITGKDDIKNEEKGLLAGAVDYITKPIRPVIVKARINTHLIIKYQRDELIYNSSHDQLTQLYNRHHLVQEGTRKFSKALRQGENFCAVIADIDHFKLVNDNYGHLTGDKVLKEVAEILNKRVENLTARYGGEEFVILFINTNIEEARKISDKLLIVIKDDL